jgi:hypothetical protein
MHKIGRRYRKIPISKSVGEPGKIRQTLWQNQPNVTKIGIATVRVNGALKNISDLDSGKWQWLHRGARRLCLLVPSWQCGDERRTSSERTLQNSSGAQIPCPGVKSLKTLYFFFGYLSRMELFTLKNLTNCFNTNINYTSGGQSSNPYLNVVHFFNNRAQMNAFDTLRLLD